MLLDSIHIQKSQSYFLFFEEVELLYFLRIHLVSLVENLALTQSFEHYNKGIVTATHVGQSMMEMVHSGVRGVILKRGVKKIGFGKG